MNDNLNFCRMSMKSAAGGGLARMFKIPSESTKIVFSVNYYKLNNIKATKLAGKISCINALISLSILTAIFQMNLA